MKYKVIKTEAQHKKAVKRAMEIFMPNPERPEDDEKRETQKTVLAELLPFIFTEQEVATLLMVLNNQCEPHDTKFEPLFSGFKTIE